MVSLPVKDSQGCSFFGWKLAVSQTRPLLVIFPHSKVHSQVHFLRPTYSTCTLQSTLLFNFPSSVQRKYKALFPLKPLRKPYLFPLDTAAQLRFFFLLSPHEWCYKRRQVAYQHFPSVTHSMISHHILFY